jgi:hypothetical protein
MDIKGGVEGRSLTTTIATLITMNNIRIHDVGLLFSRMPEWAVMDGAH